MPATGCPIEVSLEYTPFDSPTGGAVTAPVRPAAGYQPTGILRSSLQSLDTPAGCGVTTTGDVIDVYFITPDEMQGSAFQCIALKGFLVCPHTYNSDFNTMFTGAYGYRAVPYVSNAFGFYVDTMSSVCKTWDKSTFRSVKSLDCPSSGFPYDYSNGENVLAPFSYSRAIGVIQIPVSTYNANVATYTSIHADARWLVYPRNALSNSGMFVPSRDAQPA